MNILVLSREFPPYVLGGISYHLRNLYNEIDSEGHDITVLAGKCPQSWSDLEATISSQISIEPVEFGFRKGYYLLYPVAVRKKLSLLNLDDFDLAVAHTPIPYRIPGLPLVTKYHDCVAETRQYMRAQLSLPEKIGDSLLHPFRKVIDQRSLHITDHAIFNSGINKWGWTNNYHFDGASSIIHNGVDTNIFLPINGDRKKYVVFVGTTEQKGLSSVIDYADLKDRPVHIVGDIQLDHSNIVCLGRVSQDKLSRIYAKAAATIHPAYFESFGNSVLESLACGTPVVTTPTCGASEVLTDETGAVNENLHKGIEKVVSLESEDCRKVATEYEWSDVAERTIRIFNEVKID